MYNLKQHKPAVFIIALLTLTMLICGRAWALPNGATVVSGSSAITQPNANTMHINQTSDKSIINWQGYSIGANDTVQYFQPGSGSISFNRVTGIDPSLLYGKLSANGQVWVINPNGLLIGKGADINVGSFLGSTLNIKDKDFLDGKYTFSTGINSLTNLGSITTADGGYLVFISPSITNEGKLTSKLGKTYLASGDEVTLNFAGNDLIGFTVDKAAVESAAGITNKGTISADGGEVILKAEAAGDLLKTVINNEGVIQARTIENRNGRILLLSGMDNGETHVSGTLDASAPDSSNGGDGGFIETSGANVKIEDNARITTLAADGRTGTWLIDPNDYSIAASGGNITGSALATNLASSNVTISTATQGTAGGNGDIFVNDAVSWSANTTLSLQAERDIQVNANITATGNTAGLTLGYGSGRSYSLNTGKITLSGSSPTLKIGVAASESTYTVINSLGAAGSTTGTDLQGMKGNLSGKYALGSDIDASATSSWNSGAGFDPVGNYQTWRAIFTGIFDGMGHTITGLTINRSTSHLGLFGVIYTGGIVKNVGLVGGSVTTTGSGQYHIGGLAGLNENGTISNSYNTGSVNGNGWYVGGLVGTNYVTISNSYSTGSVAGYEVVGGLVGWNAGTISKSYSIGAVSGSNNLGGLVGTQWGAGNANNSFWDTVTSGQSSSGGGIGKTTAEMKTASTFTDAGWNLTSTWGIKSSLNSGYPVLREFYYPWTTAITLTLGDLTKTYGDANPSLTNAWSVSGCSGCVSTLDWGSALTTSTSAGTYNYQSTSNLFSPTYAIDSASDYEVSYSNNSITVNAKTLTISGFDAANKTYNANNTATINSEGSLSGVISGDTVTFSYSGATFDNKNVGTGKTVTLNGLTLSGVSAANYSIATTTDTANITAKTITLTGFDAASKTYDGATTATINNSGSLSGVITGDTVTVSNNGATFSDKNVATGKTVTLSGVTLAGTDSGNYSIATTVTDTADITAKTITLTGFDAASKTYDGGTTATINNSGSLSGVVSGDTVTVSNSGAAFSDESVGTGKTVTLSGVTLAGTDSGNYSITGTATDTADIAAATTIVTGDDTITSTDTDTPGDIIPNTVPNTGNDTVAIIATDTADTTPEPPMDVYQEGLVKSNWDINRDVLMDKVSDDKTVTHKDSDTITATITPGDITTSDADILATKPIYKNAIDEEAGKDTYIMNCSSAESGQDFQRFIGCDVR